MDTWPVASLGFRRLIRGPDQAPFSDSQVGTSRQRVMSRGGSAWATSSPRAEFKLQTCLDAADVAGWLPERSGWLLMADLTILTNWRGYCGHSCHCR